MYMPAESGPPVVLFPLTVASTADLSVFRDTDIWGEEIIQFFLVPPLQHYEHFQTFRKTDRNVNTSILTI